MKMFSNKILQSAEILRYNHPPNKITNIWYLYKLIMDMQSYMDSNCFISQLGRQQKGTTAGLEKVCCRFSVVY